MNHPASSGSHPAVIWQSSGRVQRGRGDPRGRGRGHGVEDSLTECPGPVGAACPRLHSDLRKSVASFPGDSVYPAGVRAVGIRFQRIDEMSRRRVGCLGMSLLAAIGAAATAGCARPATQTLHPVKGRVTFAGQPLTSGSVSFRPDSPQARWHQPTGLIASDGQYDLFTDGQRGAPPGTYRVVIFSSATTSSTGAAPGLPVSRIPTRYNHPEQSPLRAIVEVVPRPGAYDLELIRDE